jgi:hypothetical protein
MQVRNRQFRCAAYAQPWHLRIRYLLLLQKETKARYKHWPRKQVKLLAELQDQINELLPLQPFD